jgi:hypothetical protein
MSQCDKIIFYHMTFVEQTGVNILGFILCYLFESHDIQIPDNIPTVSTEIFMI